ncbi:MAG: ATP-dependent zinc metalloprotease FtsH [Clostridia bacterium]|nr:ATP-dependent zinc metalloprotease FtsH [Clostridia bacterium]MBQ2326419.1 ATP-dependent zinc metalloprotease FtsH [Clostridia bacterium]
MVLMGTIGVMLDFPTGEEPLAYSDVVALFKGQQVEAFVIEENYLTMQLKDESIVEYELPSVEIFYYDLGETIAYQREAGIIKMQDFQVAEVSILSMFMPYIIMIGLIVAFYFFFAAKQGGGAGGGMNFGKAKTKKVDAEAQKVRFKDVAGANEEKADLQEVVQFLKAPQRFLSLGARIPKGVLLVGPPGTGKTLIAKAVAGEAGVPFFSISGSDFVELYVGVGASRVRDLFGEAKKHAPSIIFIDEIDAVGRRRGAGLGGGHDEREQTLNQLLVEMDGFGNNSGVIVMAATNRADILDPALLRPGRFDRQIYIGVPDVKGREDILKVHAQGKPFTKDVNLRTIASKTVGFTGADLENLLNEAALLAARAEHTAISMDDLNNAYLKVIMGNEKKSRVISEHEKKLTAYHEAGHALVTRLLPSQDPVHQVSIIPRGRAGGFTMSLPKEDKYYASRNEMLDELVVLLGGRVAEKLVLDDISTGASNDIERATDIARGMVTKYGMSDRIGPISFNSKEEVFLGRDFAQSKNMSEATSALIDEEIKRIIDEAYNRCTQMISDNMPMLDKIAQALIEHETIGEKHFEAIFTGEEIDWDSIEESGLLDDDSAKASAPAVEAEAAQPSSEPAAEVMPEEQQ